MTEEKKDDLNEQQTFLSGHEELLKSIQSKTEIPDEQPKPVEPVESSAPIEVVEEEAPVVEETLVIDAEEEETPIAETTEEVSPVVEEAPVIEEPVAEEEAPAADPEPVVEAPVAQQPAPAPSPNKLNGKKKKTPAKPQHSPQHEEVLKKQALEQQEVKEVLVFLQKYAKPAAIVIITICVLVLADKFFKSQRVKKELRADTALMHAQNAEDLQDILNEYGSTPAAPVALMGLAREKFNAGQIDEAEVLYSQFVKKHDDLEQAALAELNLISCKEAKEQLGEAHLLYGEFVKDHEGSYLVPSALMGRARCLETLGELDEAQIAYEDIIVNYPESSWSQLAKAKLKIVLAKKQ